jgi:hypothetical protein
MKAELTVKGVTYSITSSSLSFGQGANANGVPTSEIYSGPIVVHLDSISNSDGVKDANKTKIVEWMNKPDGKEDGEINFYIMDDKAVNRKIEFKQALCTGWAEGWGSNGMTLTITIVPQTTIVEGIPFKGPQNKS